MDTKAYLSYWAASYKEDLLGNILPFWLEHGLDKVNGGIYTCLTRTGELMDSTKSVWFQAGLPSPAVSHTIMWRNARNTWMLPS